MNIDEAKEEIRRTAVVYLTKDEYGSYITPVEKQRPVFVLGAPGIGKTAIMEQVARELDVALVSYSMTHHTRQSALGLPLIRQRTFGEETFDVTEYTMSEIISSIYEKMEKTGKKEGILFLDEINCVSETLSPSMLQFLQYKTFGTHRVPEGWVIVTAGNPPQFNRSVREFDVVTLDRMKILEIDPDYPAWREYASNRHVHRAIMTYLDIKKDHFYQVETTVDGKSYVTARGWEDLSEMMTAYEKNGFPVDEVLIGQYLRNKKITQSFALYYELFRKYRSDYQVFDILEGCESEDVDARAKSAPFDERISLTGLLLDAVRAEISDNVSEERRLKKLLGVLKNVKADLTGAGFGSDGRNADEVIKDAMRHHMEEMEKRELEESLEAGEKAVYGWVFDTMKGCRNTVKMEAAADDGAKAFSVIKADYDRRLKALRDDAERVRDHLDNLFAFIEKVYGTGNELLILVTEMTVSRDCVVFIGQYGCEAYDTYSKNLQLYERRQELMRRLAAVDIEPLGE